jgi:hypothetical protein
MFENVEGMTASSEIKNILMQNGISSVKRFGFTTDLGLEIFGVYIDYLIKYYPNDIKNIFDLMIKKYSRLQSPLETLFRLINENQM